MEIVFMGTPEFAIPSLEIIKKHYDIPAIVTATDKPAGRGNKITTSPVKLFALENNIPVFQPESLTDPAFLKSLKDLRVDLFVVVAFRILPREVFTLPPKGTINLHASLLPKYRGAAPINWAIINGETETGVTTFFIDEKVDTGEILLQRKISITPDMTAGELHDELSIIGAKVLLETIEGIANDSLKPKPQTGEISKAPKIAKELGLINWAEPADKINNLVRGLSPYPGSYTFYRGNVLKILKSQAILENTSQHQPSVIIDWAKNGPIYVQTGHGILALLFVQPEGKKILDAGEFIRGYRLVRGEKFS